MIERSMFSAFLILVLLGAIPASAQTLPAEVVRYADFVFYNGPILTVDTDQGDFTVACYSSPRYGHAGPDAGWARGHDRRDGAHYRPLHP